MKKAMEQLGVLCPDGDCLFRFLSTTLRALIFRKDTWAQATPELWAVFTSLSRQNRMMWAADAFTGDLGRTNRARTPLKLLIISLFDHYYTLMTIAHSSVWLACHSMVYLMLTFFFGSHLSVSKLCCQTRLAVSHCYHKWGLYSLSVSGMQLSNCWVSTPLKWYFNDVSKSRHSSI